MTEPGALVTIGLAALVAALVTLAVATLATVLAWRAFSRLMRSPHFLEGVRRGAAASPHAQGAADRLDLEVCDACRKERMQ